jgi:DNA-binding CsgD family transcriptional regulator
VTRRLGYADEAGQELLRATLRLVADGRTNRQIASELGLSEHAVKDRLRALFRDLGARDRAHAVALGIRTGFVDGASAPAVPSRHRATCATHVPRACDCGALGRS